MATASCLLLVYFLPSDHPASGVFAIIGYVGGLLFLSTGLYLYIAKRGGLPFAAKLNGLALLLGLRPIMPLRGWSY